ncbi:MAG: hypothetical protein KC684_03330 [Candidatus Omnitrophica bacterium]|nr:hypothetical protein [Candidatus Omnitrophota bacterium]
MKKLTLITSLMLIFMVSVSINAMASVSATKSYRVSVTIPEIVGVNVLRPSDNPEEAKLISEKSLKNIEFTILVRNSQRYLVRNIVVR